MNENVVGIDIGKTKLTAIRLLQDGRRQRKEFSSGAGGCSGLLSWLNGDLVALEAGNQAFRIARMIRQAGCEVVVLNPGDLATIYNSLKKTDREDACVQSGLTHCRRADMAGPARRTEIATALPDTFRAEFIRLERQLKSIEDNISDVRRSIRDGLRADRAYTALVMSMPGVGPVTALALKAFIGDGSRFSRAAQVSNYVGLVPRVEISITGRGCVLIRRSIVQGAWSMIQSPYAGPLNAFYERVQANAGRKKGGGGGPCGPALRDKCNATEL